MRHHKERAMMTRTEHVAWAKARALNVLETGTVEDAYASMVSDLRQHPDLVQHAGIALGMALLMAGHLGTKAKMRDHIEGYH
jgi:hypothetical protein